MPDPGFDVAGGPALPRHQHSGARRAGGHRGGRPIPPEEGWGGHDAKRRDSLGRIALGPDGGQFNHKRFLKSSSKVDTHRRPPAAFRAFGSGHVLCPGRHFASTEALAFLALVLARFDARPVAGEWVEPKKDTVMDRACPLPKIDIDVELCPHDDKEWRVIFSDTQAVIDIVAEDLGEA